MSTVPPRRQRPRVLLFGLECQTTRIVLDGLVAGGVDIALVCMPGPPNAPLIQAPAGRASGSLPFVASPLAGRTVTATAHRHAIDVWRIGDLRSREVQRALAGVDADMLVVACYDRLIPEVLYARLPLGGLNIHPSLLPDKRGPDPLFWVFHDGDELAGVTIHRLSGRFDAGPIIAQRSHPIPDGISEDELDAQLATLGAVLLLESLPALADQQASEQPQEESTATWAPHPGPADWLIDESWTARRGFNFVRGLAGRGQPITVRQGDRELRIIDALTWHDRCGDAAPGAVAILLADGVLIARVEPLADG